MPQVQGPRWRTFQVSPGQELFIAGGLSPHSWILTHSVYIFNGSLEISTKRSGFYHRFSSTQGQFRAVPAFSGWRREQVADFVKTYCRNAFCLLVNLFGVKLAELTTACICWFCALSSSSTLYYHRAVCSSVCFRLILDFNFFGSGNKTTLYIVWLFFLIFFLQYSDMLGMRALSYSFIVNFHITINWLSFWLIWDC